MGAAGRSRPVAGEGGTLNSLSQQQGNLLGSNETYAQVLIDRAARGVDRPFTYIVPSRLAQRVVVGSRVLVPFGPQKLVGDVVGFTDQAPPAKLKSIIKLLDDRPLFDEGQLDLARWVAQRYCCPLREALRLVTPPGVARARFTTITMTDEARQIGPEQLSRAPRQAQILDLLHSSGGEEDLDNLIQQAQHRADGKLSRAAVLSAVRSLEEKGLVERRRGLSRPTAGRRTQQVVRLCDGDTDWAQVIEQLSATAPRQAEVVQALTESNRPIPVAELSHSAVAALADKGLVRVSEQRIHRIPEEPGLGNVDVQALRPTQAQYGILQHVYAAVQAHRYEALLLHGVTASGKTEVYLQAIEAAQAEGRSAIVLVPEIALTPQMVGRFRARFGDSLALLHSALSAGERYDEWERVQRGEADIVIGARSAIFAPAQNLGIIVVDEEHEHAYKQESTPRYLATTVAAERARRSNAVLLMGSATPSVEAYYRACHEDGLSLMTLPERIDSHPLPPVQVIDLRTETLMGKGGSFSQMMLEAIADRLGRGEQTILFLNRRGFSTFVMCRDCGYVLRCPDCAVSLTYHHASRRMRCHHCDYSLPVPDLCPNCKGYEIGFYGLGTERVTDQIKREFGAATVARMDRDTVGRKGAYGDILRSFARGEADILVGTQMIAKGLDLPNVTLVGVLNADVGLHTPDFRAAERTFQLLTQVAGRAGRAEKPGEVLVQTYNPDHYAVVTAQKHDYVAFYEREIRARRHNLYPPFVELANLVFQDEDEEKALNTARRAAVCLQDMGAFFKKGDVQFLGPAPAPLHKLRGRYRYQMLLKAADMERLNQTIQDLMEALADTGSTQMVCDVEPMDMM